MPDTALRTLLAGSIDYAGLFPPAGLDMATSVRQYADYRRHPDAWALGRFVVPAARLAELEREAAPLAPAAPADPWRLSALLGPDFAGELHALGEFNCRHAADGAPALSADVVEARADSVEAIDRLLAAVPRWAQAYVEIPLDRDPARSSPRSRGAAAGRRSAPAASPRTRSRRPRPSPASSAPAPTPACHSRRPRGCTIPSAPSTASPTRTTARAAPCSASSTSSSPLP